MKIERGGQEMKTSEESASKQGGANCGGPKSLFCREYSKPGLAGCSTENDNLRTVVVCLGTVEEKIIHVNARRTPIKMAQKKKRQDTTQIKDQIVIRGGDGRSCCKFALGKISIPMLKMDQDADRISPLENIKRHSLSLRRSKIS
jgi:hypothetical protein